MAKQLPAIIEPAHSETSPSSMGRWKPCPGSVTFIRNNIPSADRKSSKDSATGTLAHSVLSAWLAHILHDGDDWEEKYGLGTKHEVDGYKLTVDQKIIDGVEVAIDFVIRCLSKFKIHPKNTSIEESLRLVGTDTNGKPRKGTLDIALWTAETLIVADYKNGTGVTVEVERNPQIMSYAAGKYRALNGKFKNVILVVIQPNRIGGSPIQTWETTPEDLTAFENECLDALVDVSKPDAPLVAGDHCYKYFCSAEGICPARIKEVGSKAELDFEQVNTIPMQMLFNPQALEPEKLAMLMNVEESVTKYFSAVRKVSKGILEAGGEMAKRLNDAGYQLVETFGNRKYVDEAAAMAHYQEILGDDAIRPGTLKPLGEIEKLLKKKKLTVDLNEYTEKKSNGTEVAKIDGRTPAPNTALNDWNGVTIDV